MFVVKIAANHIYMSVTDFDEDDLLGSVCLGV